MSIAEANTALPLATDKPERFKAVVIGGGQAGLSAGYHLAKRNIPFVILDANARVGDAWRKRWDSLRLFTPSQLDGLDGMPFPAPAGSFPTKDAMGDYLEAYAHQFKLPVRNDVRVDGVTRLGERYLVTSGPQRFEAEHVIVAMATYQQPTTPACAADLDTSIVQLHSVNYRNPSQLRDGPVLLVGAGNSGAEIAVELAQTHETWLAGNDVGEVPFQITSWIGRFVQAPLVLRGVFHHLLTTDTPMGRATRAKHAVAPLIRTKSRELAAAGVKRAPKVAGVKSGLPVLADGRTLNVANIIWCTGFHTDFSWVHASVFDETGAPRHKRGIVASEPGLYFLGLNFLYAQSSTMIHGVGRDARHIADTIATRVGAEASVSAVV